VRLGWDGRGGSWLIGAYDKEAPRRTEKFTGRLSDLWGNRTPSPRRADGGGLPDSVLRIDLEGLKRDGKTIPVVTPVGRHYGMPGGGNEIYFPDAIDAKYLSLVRKP